LLLEAEQLAEDIKAHRGSPNGHVRLALLTSISTILLTPLLSRINDRYPGIQVHVLEGLAEDVEEWLTSGRADLGILYGDRRTASPTDEHLMSAELYLISAWEDPIGGEETFSLKGVSELPLILPALPNLWRRSIERACADHHIALHVPFELDAIQTIKNLVATKHRYSILPLHAVLREVNEGVLKVSRIVEPTITREVFLSLSTQRPHSRASSEVAATIRKVLIELVRSGELPGRV
jgi:LysR family nitrogen assimilation transcriptional regulator